MINPKLIPLLALRTVFGYQLKLQESVGSKYRHETNTEAMHRVVRQDSYYEVLLEDMGDLKDQSDQTHRLSILLSENELVELYKGLKRVMEEKGY